MTRQTVAIVHPEWGIFVGIGLGLAFWSALDCVGQDTVPVMTEDEARAFIDSWPDCPVKSDGFTYHPVQIAGDHWATIEELDAAGLSEWTVPLKSTRMGEAMGSA